MDNGHFEELLAAAQGKSLAFLDGLSGDRELELARHFIEKEKCDIFPANTGLHEIV